MSRGGNIFGDWIKIPSTVHPIVVGINPKDNIKMLEFSKWCRDNLKGRVHIPETHYGRSILNSDNLPRPKTDYENPYHTFTYGQNREFQILVLCEDLNDVMKIKLAWC
jgi:hypothetical protein